MTAKLYSVWLVPKTAVVVALDDAELDDEAAVSSSVVLSELLLASDCEELETLLSEEVVSEEVEVLLDDFWVEDLC